FVFTVSLTNPADEEVTVLVSTSTGTADATDFTEFTDQLLTFAVGETQKTVTVTVNDDGLYELNETFTLQLSDATYGGVTNLDVVDIADASGLGTINDNDVIGVSINNVSNVENGVFEFIISLDAALDETATVLVNTATGTADTDDFTAVVDQLVTFAAGETSKSVIVTVDDDNVVETDETFTLNLSDAKVNGVVNPALLVIGNATGLGTIENNDQLSISVDDVSENEEEGTITFTISLDKEASEDVSVLVSTQSGTAIADADFTQISNQQVTFAAGETTQTVTVSITNDTIVEDNEEFTVILSDEKFDSVVDSNRVTIADDTGVGTILNTEVASISINDVTTSEDGTFTFTVSLDTPASEEISVLVSTVTGTADSTDFTEFTDQLLTFAAGETSKTVTVIVNDDALIETDEAFTLELSDAKFNGVSSPSQVTISDSIGLGTITSNSLRIGDVTADEDGTFEFTIELNEQASDDITVLVSTIHGTTDASDLTMFTDQLVTFIAGETSKTVTVTVNDDSVVELAETFSVVLSSPIHTGTAMDSQVTLIDATAIGTITNNDGATLSIDDVIVNESAGVAIFTVTLDNEVNSAFSVDYATEDWTATTEDGDYVATSNTINFAGTANETH
ncbi:MAG: hypothetical protein KDA77_16820, partial [Planctomycetaceae bacterium]|nr:hypothetical protein [Planctomycetaceae bacterium]